MKKHYFLLFILAIFVVPSLTYAAWWKPSTWFKKSVPAPIVQTKSDSPAPTNAKIATTSSASKAQTSPIKKETATTKPKTDQSAEIEKLKKEVEELKNKRADNSPSVITQPIAPTGILCNGTYWSKCPAEKEFVCPSSGNAYCQSKQQQLIDYLTPTTQQQNQLSQEQKIQSEIRQEKIDAMLKVLNNQLLEIQHQKEIALQQIYITQEEMKQKQAPIQTEIDGLNAKRKELECDKTDMSRIIGSIAQECSSLASKITVLWRKISAITSEYSVKMGLTQSTDFTMQQSVLGQHYEFYYDGYGGGSIYNISNPNERYKIYCAYSKCNIYGN